MFFIDDKIWPCLNYTLVSQIGHVNPWSFRGYVLNWRCAYNIFSFLLVADFASGYGLLFPRFDQTNEKLGL